MSSPKDLRYTKDHEWLRLSSAEGIIGITDFAQSQLGDVVYVDLPKVGAAIKRGETFGTVESVKTVSDLFSPIDGTVTAVNEALSGHPEKVNQDPYNGGWMIKVKVSNTHQTDDLLTAEAYDKHVSEAGH